MSEIVFWVGIIIVLYTYVGYGFVISVMAALFGKKNKLTEAEIAAYEPAVTLIVAAWNEADWIKAKAENMHQLDYPVDKMEIIFCTDGSDDGTPDLLSAYPGFKVLHKPERAGKIAAMERAVEHANNDILIFSDANALLNPEAVRNIVKHYANKEIGAVAGEKRIIMGEEEAASGAGEGIYWKYESYLKKKDFEFYSVVGAAGELFSVRKSLYEAVEPDTLLDDFMISLRVAAKGYRVAYAPDANASEKPSAHASAEMTRKIRIAAGGIQSIVRLRHLLNPFPNPKLWFQYVSHRVLRWTLAPLLLPVLFIFNVYLAFSEGQIYQLILALQLLFYFFALMGYMLERRKIKLKIFFIPFYFIMMNTAVYLGFRRYIRRTQSVNWERAQRAV
ncbi:MAG: glycosyltransferase family 2 protein [Balneolales bacterium]|nr:glycosyltransferase family 2 protein [Balneolales bacterium]